MNLMDVATPAPLRAYGLAVFLAPALVGAGAGLIAIGSGLPGEAVSALAGGWALVTGGNGLLVSMIYLARDRSEARELARQTFDMVKAEQRAKIEREGYLSFAQTARAEKYTLQSEDGHEGVYLIFEGVPDSKILQLAASVVRGDTSMGINHRTEGRGGIFKRSEFATVREELVKRGLAVDQAGQVVLNSAGKRWLRDLWARANSPTTAQNRRMTA